MLRRYAVARRRAVRAPLAPSASIATLPRFRCAQRPRAPTAPARRFSSAPDAPRAPAPRAADDGTIYALSTAPGRAAIAIVRVAGPASRAVYAALCPRDPLPPPRRVGVRTLRRPAAGDRTHAANDETEAAAADGGDDVLDRDAVVLFLPGPRTATGDDVLELHLHGGPAIVRGVLDALAALRTVHPRTRVGSGDDADGAGATAAAAAAAALLRRLRPAAPGDFTRRAFQRGRLDLAGVESLGDALHAETATQRRRALGGAALGGRYEGWRARLVGAQGALEALIDFSEDHSLHDDAGAAVAGIAREVGELKGAMARAARNAVRGELLRGGVRVALVGAPNAGKSSLLNAVVGREAAIVSAAAGTTRDVVEVNVDVGGYFCKLWDLAGIRRGDDGGVGEIEREGMRRAREHARQADVVLAVTPVEDVLALRTGARLREGREEAWEDIVAQARADGRAVLRVYNKIDLLAGAPAVARMHADLGRGARVGLDAIYPVSCKLAAQGASTSATPDSGMDALLDGLKATLQSLTHAEGADGAPGAGRWEETLGANHRQQQLLVEAQEHLDRFARHIAVLGGAATGAAEPAVDLAICAEDLRAAADCMAKITGRGDVGDVEEVLGVVFERFCVGK